MSESEAHKILKERAKREFKKQGFKTKEIHVEDNTGSRIPDIRVGDTFFEGGNIDVEKFIEYKEEGKKLVYQPYLSSLSKNKGKKLKYVCMAIDEFCKNMGFIESGSYSYRLGCLRISMWAVYQKYRYPKIETFKIYLSNELLISKTVPDFMQIRSFLNNLFYEFTAAISEREINAIRNSIHQECQNKREELKQEAQTFCDLKNNQLMILTKSISEEKEGEVRMFLEGDSGK